MGLKDLNLRFKVLRLRRFLIGNGGGRRENENEKPLWMAPISHGSHVVEVRSMTDEPNELDSDTDSVVVHRQEVEGMELCFFGLFNGQTQIGDGVTQYLHSHLFDKQSQIKRSSKETMRKAYIGARAKMMRETEESSSLELGSASAFVINGEKLVVANMGNYKAVVSRDGKARHFTKRHNQTSKWKFHNWYRKFIPRIQTKSSEVVVGSQRIESGTEFVILASTGIWEVMRHQEAVNLIGHIEDPQEAAQCLAKEAIVRMSRSTISCLVIRFK